VTSLFPVSPQKAKADLKKRLEEDQRLQRWKSSTQAAPTPTPATATAEQETPPPAEIPQTISPVLHRREGRYIRVPFEHAPAFERRHGFTMGAVRELYHPDTGEVLEVIFEGEFETRPL